MQSKRIKHVHAIRGKLSLVLQGFPDYPNGFYCDPLRSLHDVAAFHSAIDELLQSSVEPERDRRMEAYAHDVLDLAARLASALEPDGSESLGAIIPELVTCAGRLCDYIAPPKPIETTDQTQEEPRRGRLSKDEKRDKNTRMLAILRSHPTLKDSPRELADRIGVNVSTVRRWLNAEERKYLDSRACQAEPDE